MSREYASVAKRLMDISIAGCALAVLAPIGAVIALLVRVTSPGPVIFKQPRLGEGRAVFDLWKFRTMRQDASAAGADVMTSAADPRVTPLGRYLRPSGLDELPQLVNVLLGDMSIVGPRPPVPHHPYPADDYPEWAIPRFEVRPGITGLAQVSGRNLLSWDERLRMDVEYVGSWTLRLDVWIMIRTLGSLNRRVLHRPTTAGHA